MQNESVPHDMPDVQPFVEVWPLSKPGLQLAHPITHAAATVHVQQPQCTYSSTVASKYTSYVQILSTHLLRYQLD